MNIIQNKNLIGISALILAFGVSYYFAFYLPQRNKENTLSQNIVKCQELGVKRYEKDLAGDSFGKMTLSPEYKYNEKLKTCLYKGSSITLNGPRIEYITDLYTNKKTLLRTSSLLT